MPTGDVARQHPVMDAPYRHIACCIDRSDVSMHVLAEAARLRAVGPGRLSIVHVSTWGILFGAYPGVTAVDPEVVSEDAQRWLDDVVAAYPGAEGVLLDEWARQSDVDLIVASSSRGLVDRVLLGSFAGYVARHAPCSVLLVRPFAHK
jgi:nucleotide-binding universal stress UspA family protein